MWQWALEKATTLERAKSIGKQSQANGDDVVDLALKVEPGKITATVLRAVVVS